MFVSGAESNPGEAAAAPYRFPVILQKRKGNSPDTNQLISRHRGWREHRQFEPESRLAVNDALDFLERSCPRVRS